MRQDGSGRSYTRAHIPGGKNKALLSIDQTPPVAGILDRFGSFQKPLFTTLGLAAAGITPVALSTSDRVSRAFSIGAEPKCRRGPGGGRRLRAKPKLSQLRLRFLHGLPSKFPTHTPTACSAVTPTAQASRNPELVPILHGTRLFSKARGRKDQKCFGARHCRTEYRRRLKLLPARQ